MGSFPWPQAAQNLTGVGPVQVPAGGNIPAAVAAIMMAQGAPTAISLLELQLVNGNRFFIADAPALAIPLLAQFDGIVTNPNNGGSAPVIDPHPVGVGGPTVIQASQPSSSLAQFLPWIIDPPQFGITNTLVTQTAIVTYQNTSGNTVMRDNSLLFSQADLWGAIFVYRLWLAAAEFALFTQYGTVADAEVDEMKVELTLKSSLNFSEITAPDCTIGPNCQNQFGSQQCGSTSPTPCQNTYGTCSQLNRFKGVVTQWNDAVVSVGSQLAVAQPAPAVALNPRRPG